MSSTIERTASDRRAPSGLPAKVSLAAVDGLLVARVGTC